MLTSSQQIKLGAILSYISITVNIIMGLLYTPWMINAIGKENYGLYTLALSVVSLFVFDFGLSASINRFISKYLAEKDYEKANNCLSLVYRLYFYIDFILLTGLTAVFFFIPNIYKELTPDEIEKFKIIYCMSAIYAVLSFPFIPVNGILSANEKFVELKSCEVIHKVLIVGMMTACLLMGYGLYMLVFVNAVAGILMILMKLYLVKTGTKMKVNNHYHNKQELRDIIGFSSWITVMSLCQRSIFTLGPTILGAFTGSAAIAIFGIANTLEGYVFTFTSALSGMFLPKISRIVASDGDVLPLMIKVGRIQLMLVSLIVLGFCCIGLPFINLWLGTNFSESYLCTVLIIVPALIQLPQEIGDQTLYATNKIRERSVAFIMMAVVNIALGIPLTIYLGALGLCISICIAYIIRTVVLDIIFKVKLHIDLKKFFKETFLAFLPAFALLLVIGYCVMTFISIDGWIGLLIKGLVFTLSYIIIIRFMVMNEEEIALVNNTIQFLTRKLKL